MNRNIGFISLIPDGGHVLPLLKMASAFMEKKYNVTCYFPEESLKYASDFNIPVKSIGKVTQGVDKELFARLSKRSIFYNSFYIDLEKEYSPPIQLTIAKKMEYIKDLLVRDDLSLIIADSNFCDEWCRLFATLTKIPLIFHLSEGSCRNWQRPFISAYGITNHSLLTQTIIEVVMNWFQQLHRRRLSSSETNRIYKKIFILMRRVVSSIKTELVSPIYITSGLGFIESEMIKKSLTKVAINHLLFPPISDRRMVKIPQMLQDWFDKGGKKPVVYVCFGTMVKGQKRFFQKIINGLKDFKINILWSAPDDQASLLKEIGIPPNLRIEKFVPQSRVLALDQVRCFITHGGSGGIQECLLFGKPILCIPFMFDQPYNGSIIELLQAGIKIWKNKVSSRSIKKAVAQLLYNQKYWEAAQGIMKKLRAQDGGEAIIQHLLKIGILSY
jgi:UDP:flavonoid glycosyltransferase YjiC (YdhE family)